MTSPQNQPIKLELTIQPEQPELLAGLELWLQLGLISDREVKRVAQLYLTCLIPQTAAALTPIGEPGFIVDHPAKLPTPYSRPANPIPAPATSVRQPDFIVDHPAKLPTAYNRPANPVVSSARPARTPWITQLLTSLMAELSVVWLLFLGVFMVVVSSAVLAASQWKNFSAVGQYSILWGYTLVFGIVGIWAGKRSHLRLTGQMLQATTLLIIPINFWMIDGFNLWRSPLAWGIGLIAALSLVGMMVKLLQQSSQRDVLNTIGLSVLQWGWLVPELPLAATYVGTVGTAVLQISRPQSSDRLRPVESPRTLDNSANSASRLPFLPHGLIDLGKIAISFSTLLLIARATLVSGIPFSQLGLALGICGWILCWNNRRNHQPLWLLVGAGFLGFGWLVTVTTDQLWQAIGISLLCLWLLAERLRRLWLMQDTVAIVLVGLQTYMLFRVLFPPTFRRSVISLITQWAELQQGAWELTGLGFFLYLLIILLFAVYLRRQHHPQLALVAEQMALGLGSILLIPSVYNPLVRALYLSLSGVTLGLVLWRRSHLPWLIYLTHITGLFAIISWIGWGFPNLSDRLWAVILLTGMSLEWGLCWLSQNRSWQLSAWQLGLGLAACSYPLLVSSKPVDAYWNLEWLVTPLLLTLLARRSTFAYPRWASWLSVVALLLTPYLTSSVTMALLISLVIATAIMAVNTKQLQQLAAAVITVGFGLATAATTAYQIWQPFPSAWVPVGVAIALWCLWLLRHGWRNDQNLLSSLYVTALNGWAIALSLFNLFTLTVIVVNVALYQATPLTGHYALAIGLTTAAIVYRVWQQPTDLGLWGIAWGAELLAISGVNLAGGSWDDLAVAHLALGLSTQILGDQWLNRQPRSLLVSLQVIPLVYATFGVLCAHSHFNATTGLFTLGAAVIYIGVGRRQLEFKPLTYVGITTLSIAAYELLVYQLSRATGGAAGDGLTLMAGLAAVIAIVYPLLTRWLLLYWRISASELQFLSHLHWGIGCCFAFTALTMPLSASGSLLWMGVMITLAAHAIWAGRHQADWVYPGIATGLSVVGYALHRSLPATVLVTWGAAIACLIAFLLYTLPWRTWGWSKQPWQDTAKILPGMTVLLTSNGIGIATLLITGGFYAWLADATTQIRLTYVSLCLANWAIFRLFQQSLLTDPLWYMTLVSGSILYSVQIDPALSNADRKETRHVLRSLAVGLFCCTALYQSANDWLQGLFVLGFSLGLIVVGLGLRTRAYLYVGTLTFMVKVLLQLWAFISDYSLLLWALGILLGLLLIWVAATFEARRSQAIAVVQFWITELESWQ